MGDIDEEQTALAVAAATDAGAPAAINAFMKTIAKENDRVGSHHRAGPVGLRRLQHARLRELDHDIGIRLMLTLRCDTLENLSHL